MYIGIPVFVSVYVVVIDLAHRYIGIPLFVSLGVIDLAQQIHRYPSVCVCISVMCVTGLTQHIHRYSCVYRYHVCHRFGTADT